MYYYKDSQNFEDIVERLETTAPVVLATAAAVATAGQATPAVVAADGAAATATTKTLVTSGATAGFKKHILRSEDKWKVMRFILNGDNTVTFYSVSGDSKVGG